jgi:hypothetical protein
LRIALNGAGRRLLASRRKLKAKLLVTQALANEITRTVSTQTVTFKAAKQGHGHQGRLARQLDLSSSLGDNR